MTKRVVSKAVKRVALDPEIGFPEFFAVWAELQGFQINKYHFKIFNFLETPDKWENKTGVLQAFRNAGKSTIIACYIVWLLVRDPTLRILVQSADYGSAVQTISDVRDIIVRHPYAKHLKDDDDYKQKWREDEIYVVGSKFVRNPSVVAKGIFSNVTGRRADLILFDDVETPKSAGTELQRKKLRERLRECSRLLDPKPMGTMLYIGTPHAFQSIYEELTNNGAGTLSIPLLPNYDEKKNGAFPNIHGDTAWPEKFNPNELKLLQTPAKNNKGEFYSQYLLLPYTLEDCYLDPSFLSFYSFETQYTEAQQQPILKIGKERLVSVVAFWDPSSNAPGGDDSVLALVYFGGGGKIYVHRIFKIKSQDFNRQCDQVKRYVLEHGIPKVVIEDNAMGKVFPQLLKSKLGPVGCRVIARSTTKNKADKIRKALEVPLYSKLLRCHESIKNTKFVKQMREFDPIAFDKNAGDDYIDAVSMAIMDEPVRIGKMIQPGEPIGARWRENSILPDRYKKYEVTL